jgi:hypothetical protein
MRNYGIEHIFAETRGLTELHWLSADHSFNFGSNLNPDRIGFGKLRVLNEDTVDPPKSPISNSQSRERDDSR